MTNAYKNHALTTFVFAVVLSISALVMLSFTATAHADDCGDCGGGFTNITGQGYDFAPADFAPADFAPADFAPADFAPADFSPADFAPTDFNGDGVCDQNCSGDVGTYDSICGCNTNTQDYVTYQEQQYSSSQPSYGGSGYSSGASYGSSPSYSSSVPHYTFSAPSYSQPIIYQAQQQQQQQHVVTQQPSNYTTTNNTCTGSSCNSYDNSVTNINNSVNNSGNTSYSNVGNTNISNSGNVATVTNVNQIPQQHPVQYVYPQQPTYPTYQRPYCTISISNYNYNSYNYGNQYNQPTTLTWTSSYGTSAYISPSVGAVSPYGSMTVYPTSGQIYTMTVYGQGGTATCVTQSTYVPPVTTYIPPVTHTPYVSLTQIPYTGFDFGTFGNTIYWLSLLAFAGAASYLVFYFNGGALALAGVAIRTKKTAVTYTIPKIQMPALRSVSQVAPKVAAPVPVVAEVEQPTLPARHSLGAGGSPIQLPVAETHRSTIDTMNVHQSKAGEAPRIIITRA